MLSVVHSPVVVRAPSKVNLHLSVGDLREDGYHELTTVFQALSLSDRISVVPSQALRVIVTGADAKSVPTDERNLVWKAAVLLAEAVGREPLVDITVDKGIPVAGGMAGGSSDAASTLLGLNHIWQLGLGLDELAELGLSLGADVPVFIHGHTAWAEGIGEKLRPLDTPGYWYLVLRPDCEVSTAEIFCHEQLTRNASPIKIAAFLEGATGNSCQNLVRKLYPDVDKALNWLDQFAPAKLTGTGSCVFASFDSKSAAEAVLAQKPASTSGFVAKGVNLSPLHKTLSTV